MNTHLALTIGLQMIVPSILMWEVHKSRRWCIRYEQMLERNHRLFLEGVAQLHRIPLIENETTDELFRRMIRIQQWRQGALTPEERERIDET